MFESCPDPTIVIEGAAIVARNRAFLSRFGEASSLHGFLDPRDHAAVPTAPDVLAEGATFIARAALGEGAGVPMKWTAWALGEGKTCVRLAGPAALRDPKLAPLEPVLSGEGPASVTARLLSAVFERIDGILFALGSDGTILVSEGNGLAHFGLKPGQVVGLNAFKVYGADSPGQANTRRVLGGESFRTNSFEGSTLLATWYEPIRDAQGDVTSALGFSLSINEQAQELLQARTLLAAVEQLPIVIWSMDRDGTCVLSTGSGLKDLGLKPDELVGKNLYELYAASPTFKVDMDRAFQGETFYREGLVREMHWRSHFIPVRGLLGEEVVRVYAVSENITERTRNERRLEEQLALIQSQQEAIAGLSSPIIEVWQGVLVVPVIGNFDENRAGELLERLLADVVARQARWVILDLTGVDRVEAATAHHLFNIMRCVELLGSDGLLSGIRPSVARMMVELDINIAARRTYPTLAEALRKLIHAAGPARRLGR